MLRIYQRRYNIKLNGMKNWETVYVDDFAKEDGIPFPMDGVVLRDADFKTAWDFANRNIWYREFMEARKNAFGQKYLWLDFPTLYSPVGYETRLYRHTLRSLSIEVVYNEYEDDDISIEYLTKNLPAMDALKWISDRMK